MMKNREDHSLSAKLRLKTILCIKQNILRSTEIIEKLNIFIALKLAYK